MRTYIIIISLFCLGATTYAQGTWTSASSDGFTPRWAAVAAEIDGKIYVIGGLISGGRNTNVVEVYNPSTNSWSRPATSGVASFRWGMSAAVVNGKIYVMGGTNGEFMPWDTVNILEVFNPATNEWSTPKTTGTFSARTFHTCQVVNGKIYVIGGFNGGVTVVNIEVFDPTSNTWSTPSVTGVFTPRRGLASCVIGENIFTFGGSNGPDVYNILEVFNTTTNSWSTPTTTGTFTARRGLTTTVVGGQIFAIGGASAPYPLFNICEVYSPSTNEWSTPSVSGIFEARYGHTATLVGGKIYVLAGQTVSSITTNTCYVYTPTTSSVSDNASSIHFDISPNPTSGTITVRNNGESDFDITVLDILGKPVSIMKNQRNVEAQMDLSHLASGVYYIHITSGSRTLTKVVVRQ